MNSRHEWKRATAKIISKAKPPRQWTAMLETWGALLGALETIAASRMPLIGALPAHLAVWRWMWSLPPCSEARKAAFTLGAAALMIERWRSVQAAHGPLEPSPEDAAVGQRAESLLRIAAWHSDDARGEAHARTLGREPTIPPHERVYERDADGRFLICHTQVPVTGGCSWTSGEGHVETARAILLDHFAIRANVGRGLLGEGGATRFAETAIVSLPDGPWVMTSRDVSRFLDMILEDLRGEGPTGQDGEPARAVTEAEAAAKLKPLIEETRLS